jgi:hypothetical protein
LIGKQARRPASEIVEIRWKNHRISNAFRATHPQKTREILKISGKAAFIAVKPETDFFPWTNISRAFIASTRTRQKNDTFRRKANGEQDLKICPAKCLP